MKGCGKLAEKDLLKERFLGICGRDIKRDGINELTCWILESDFFVAPASTRYHGAYEGGLAQHSLNVFDCLTKEVQLECKDEYSPETIAIVSLFHDLCKVNFYKKGTRNVKEDGQWIQKEVFEVDEKFPCGHGEKSIIILQRFMKLTAEEIFAIRAHMGGFDTSVKGGGRFVGDIFERSKLAVLLHVADLKATYIMEGKDGDNK